MAKPADTKPWVEAAHKVPFKEWLESASSSGYIDIFDIIRVLLLDEVEWSKADVFHLARYACDSAIAEPPVSNQEIEGIIDLLCIGREEEVV